MDKQIIKVPGPNHVQLVLDPSDPDTPAMVYGGKPGRDGLGPCSATHACATGTGELEGNRDTITLTEAQVEFLEKDEIGEKVDAIYATARPEED